MIINLSIPPRAIKESSKIYYDIDENHKKFPILSIDRDSYIVSSALETGINLGSYVEGVHNLQIGKFCSIAHNITFVIDLNHDYSNVKTGDSELFIKSNSKIKRKGQILIQNDVWIGRGTTIMSGVTIHNGAVVAANSHIMKDVPPYAIVGGNPAKIIKYRFEKEIIDKLLKIQWWDWKIEKIKKNNILFNENVENFCNIFYKEALEEKIFNLEIIKSNHTYLFFLDFDEPYSIWKKIIKEFITKFKEKDDYLLLICINEEYFNTHKAFVEELNKKINDFLIAKNSKCSVTLRIDKEENERVLFKYVDYFITNRSKNTVLHSCYADENNVKILSGVDIPVF